MACLERDVAVLAPGPVDLLGAQKLEILAQALSGRGGVDDVIHEASLRRHHRVSESAVRTVICKGRIKCEPC